MFSGQKGFTLIEIIISTAIIALLSLTVGGVLSESFKTNAQELDSMIAVSIAQGKVEELRSQSFVKIYKELPIVTEKDISFNGKVFKQKINVFLENDSLIKIVVSVQLKGGELQLVTYKGNY